MENREAALARDPNVLAGTLGFTLDAEHGVATLEKTAGDRVEEFAGDFVAERFRAGLLHDRKRYPFADHGDVAGAVNRESMRFESLEIFGDKPGIVVGAGAVGAGDEDDERLGRRHVLLLFGALQGVYQKKKFAPQKAAPTRYLKE